MRKQGSRLIHWLVLAGQTVSGFSGLGLAVLIIFWLAYLLGHPILDGVVDERAEILVGNDSAFALSLVYWFERFFPRFPIWYPLQGMGVSLTYSYPMGTTFLVLWLMRLFSVSAVEVYRVLSFLTFPLTALGIYFFSWVRLKRQSIALLAAVFFLLSQASWLFQVLHGIFAQSFSLIFVAPVLLLFDLFVQKFLAGDSRAFWARVWLVGASLLLGILLLMHVVTGLMVVLMLCLWGGMRVGFYQLHFSFRERLYRLVVGGVLGALVGLFGAGLVAFWLVPFSTYTRWANREGLNTRSVVQIQEESLRIPSLAGVSVLGEGQYRYDFFFFAAPVLIFFGVGAMVGLVTRRRKIVFLSIVSLVFVLLTVVPIYLPFLASWFQFFFTAVYFRGLVPVLVTLPIVAAFGVWVVPQTLLLLPARFLRRWLFPGVRRMRGALVYLVMRGGLSLLTGFLAVALGMVVVVVFKHQPPPNPEFIKTYKYQFQAYGPSLSSTFKEFLAKPVFGFDRLPSFNVSEGGMQGRAFLNEQLTHWLSVDQATLLDVSPFAAGGAIMQGVGLVNDWRFANLYHYYASLIHRMWGYQAGVFYGSEKLFASHRLLEELTDWFGLKYVVVVPGFDPFDKYREAGWMPVVDFNEYAALVNEEKASWGIEVWENPEPENLYTATRRPVFLVITDAKEGGYDTVFRAANLGAVGYDDAWLVSGTSDIDDYTLDELGQFDGVILYGYSYRNRSRAWGRLADYVREGGSLFVDTGWQYVSKDWEGRGLAEPLPITQTKWGDIGMSWEGVEVSLADIDTGLFDPPIWEKSPWGMAVASRADLREGARVLVAKDDQVLMAEREFGEGRVVWSGMNIFSHATRRFNEAEGDFLEAVFSHLIPGRDGELTMPISMEREDPDRVAFRFPGLPEPVWFLFRESFSPYWRASVLEDGTEERVPIFSGGPGFVLMRLPATSADSLLRLDAQLSIWDGLVARGVSVMTVGLLVVYLVFGRRLRLPGRVPRVFLSLRGFESAKGGVDEEQEY